MPIAEATGIAMQMANRRKANWLGGGLSSHAQIFQSQYHSNTRRPCVRRKTHKFSLRAEHYGFIAVAAVDAFHWHSLLFLVSIWLLITGIIAEFFYTGE